MGSLLRWAIASIVFFGTFLLRFLNPHFHNEHFLFINGGRHILAYGELPFRDFLDPGQFSLYFISAAAQRIFGHNLFGDGVIAIGSLSLAATLAFLLATQASGSILLGLLMTLMFIATEPLLYNHYKLSLLMLSLWLLWRYVDRPTSGRLLALGGASALIFVTRQDLALYLGLAVLAVLVCLYWRNDLPALVRPAALYGGTVALLLLPFFLFLQLNGGIVEYYRIALDYGRREKNLLEFYQPRLVFDRFAPLVTVEPAPTASIGVRWSRQVTDDRREQLEAQFGLANPRSRGGTTWDYELADTSSANVAAIVQHEAVADTAGIDRATLRVWSPLEALWVGLQRQFPLLGVRVLPGLLQPANANVWLYYLFTALPWIALLVLAFRYRRGKLATERFGGELPKMLSAALLCAVAVRVLVPHASHSRLADVGAPLAVLGAWLVAQLLDSGSRRESVGDQPPPRKDAAGAGLLAGRWLVAAVLLGVSWLSVTTVGGTGPLFQETALSTVLAGPAATSQLARQVLGDLRRSPAEAAAPDGAGIQALTAYVRSCTQPTDRLVTTWYTPSIHYHADRSYGAGVPFFQNDHFSAPETQRWIIEQLEARSVPIVLVERATYRTSFEPHHLLLHEYLTARYRVAAESSFGDDPGQVYQVLVDGRRAPNGTYAPLSLPCFR